jgi:hypothetical protein
VVPKWQRIITWSGFNIAAGASVNVAFDVTVEAPGTGVDHLNVAEVTESDQFDPDSTPDNDDGDQSEDDEDNEENATAGRPVLSEDGK